MKVPDPLFHRTAADRPYPGIETPSGAAPLELLPIPLGLRITESTRGALILGHSGDLCWRAEPHDSDEIHRSLVAALASQHALTPGAYRLPARMTILSVTDGSLVIYVDPPDETTHTLPPETTVDVRCALAAATAKRAKQAASSWWNS